MLLAVLITLGFDGTVGILLKRDGKKQNFQLRNDATTCREHLGTANIKRFFIPSSSFLLYPGEYQIQIQSNISIRIAVVVSITQ